MQPQHQVLLLEPGIHDHEVKVLHSSRTQSTRHSLDPMPIHESCSYVQQLITQERVMVINKSTAVMQLRSGASW